jgi:Holliday junction resolvase RusA-like endonuclease
MLLGKAVEFIVQMRPVPKARPRLARNGHTYTPKNTVDAERVIALVAKGVIKQPLSGPLSLYIEFFYAVPKSWSKAKRESIPSPRTERPDLDNIGKLVLDSLNGVAYLDDAQIVHLSCSKYYGNSDSIHVTIIPTIEAECPSLTTT